MRNKILCGLTVLALAAGAVISMPGQGSAQLFNADKKKDAPAATGTTADKTKPPAGSVFNHSGKAQKPSAAPSYAAQKPKGMQSRTVPQNSDAGFNRRPAGGESAQDKAIREAAMRRMMAGEQKQAAILADAKRRTKSEAEIMEAIGNGGEQIVEDTRPQIYDKHKNTRDPAAPAKLFNSTR